LFDESRVSSGFHWNSIHDSNKKKRKREMKTVKKGQERIKIKKE
jgi:hypothetical protein